MGAFPMLGWGALYYIVLVLVYRFLVFDFITGTLDRQIIGLADTLALTAVLSAYLLLCAVAPYVWSRKGLYHPVWRGLEAFACYVAVALVLGAILAAVDDGPWSAASALAASGSIWSRIGTLAALLAIFIFASWRGGISAAARRRHANSLRRKKARTSGG